MRYFQIRTEPEGANSSPTPSPTSPTFATRKIVKSTDRPMANGSVPHDSNGGEYVDTKTPYISRIIEQKSGKSGRLIKQAATDDSNQPLTNKNEVNLNKFPCSTHTNI